VADKSLKMSIYGRDVNASKTLHNIGKTAEHTSGMISKIGTIAAGISLAHLATEAGAFVKDSLGKFAEVAGEVRTLQRYTGASAESMSKLRETAKMSGVSTQSLGKGLRQLSVFMANNKNASTIMGESVKDSTGHLKSLDSMLPTIMDKFAKMPNGPEKTAIAVKMFGRGATEMIPLLNRGSAGLKEFGDEAERNGLVLSQSNLDAVKKNTMAQRSFHSAIEGLQVQIGMRLYPVLTSITEAFMKQWPVIREHLEPAMKTFAQVCKTLGHFVSDVVLPGIVHLAKWFEKYKGIIVPIVGAIVSMVVAYKAFIAVQRVGIAIMELYKGAQILYIAMTSGMTAAQTALTFATEGGTAVTKGYAVAQAILNTVMEANPIGLVVLAIVGLVAAIVIAWKHSETFRKIVTGAFHAVANAAVKVVAWIKSHWPLLLAIITGPFGLAVLMIMKHRDQIVGFFKAVPKMLMNALNGASSWLYHTGRDIITGLFNGAKSLLSKVGSFFLDHLPSWIKEPFKKALGIQSPSKVFHEFGRFITQGLIDGLTSTAAKVHSTVSKLGSLVTSAFKNKTSSADDDFLKYLDKQESKLSKLAKQRVATTKALSTARDHLAKVRDDKKSFYSNALGSSDSFDKFSLGNGEATSSSTGNPLSNYIARMRESLSQTLSFKSNVQSLKGKLPASFVNELIAQGVSASDLVDALAHADPSTLAEITSLSKQKTDADTSLARYASEAVFGSAERSAENAVRVASRSDSNVANAQMNTAQAVKTRASALLALARGTADTASSSHSSKKSKKSHAYTGPTLPALAAGGVVTRATVALIGEAGPEAVIPLSRMKSGSSSSPVVVHVHVAGSVIREHDLAVSVRDQIAQMMRRRGVNPSILGV